MAIVSFFAFSALGWYAPSMAHTTPPPSPYGGSEHQFNEAARAGRLDRIAHEVRWALEGTFAEPAGVRETPERLPVSVGDMPRRGPEAAIKAQHPLQSMTAELLRALEAKGLVRHFEPMPDEGAHGTLSLDIYPDLTREGALLLRVSPLVKGSRAPEPRKATAVPAPSTALSTTEAARLLNVSRPYVASLCDAGVFKGVTRTQGGHRRIPQPEVLRVRQEMQATRRAALDDMLDLSLPAMEAEAERAEASARSKGRRWVSVGSATKKPS